jgi:hypothetical protein
MKKVYFFLMGSFLALFLTGCEQMQFAKYSGQQKAWPTGGSFSDQVFEVPVFRGFPEKNYDVLGYIQFDKPNVDWNQGDIKQATGMAKGLGGDALLMVAKGKATNQRLSSLCKDMGIDGSRTTAVVLKWK